VDYPQIDRFAGLNSPVHNWDPRAKIISLFCLIFSVALATSLKKALAGLFMAFFLIIIARIPLFFVLKHLKWVFIFVVPFCALILLTHHQGSEPAKFYFFSIHSKGVEKASLIAVKAIASAMIIFPLAGTTRFDLTLKALEDLRVPPKLVQMLMLTYRYIFVLLDESHKMLTAMAARGFKGGLNVNTLFSAGKLIAMLFIRSSDRAERVYSAMVSRGYEGKINTPAEFKTGKADFLKAAAVTATAIILIVL
jgi:cobalt/nickel transport system permease protein